MSVRFHLLPHVLTRDECMTIIVGTRDHVVDMTTLTGEENYRVAQGTWLRGSPPSSPRFEPPSHWRPSFRSRTRKRWLNDDYQGGATHFPALKHTITPVVGTMLTWSNLTGAGVPDLSHRHAGLPVTHGRKWIAIVWIRERCYDPNGKKH